MMKKKNKYYMLYITAVFMAVFGALSCTSLITEVSPENLPDAQPKLVVTSFISPRDKLVKVHVGTSTPIFTDIPFDKEVYRVINGDTVYYNFGDYVNDAKVVMFSDQAKVELVYDHENNWYSFIPGENTLKIEAGKKYRLEVSRKEKKVTAECTVPLKATPIGEMDVDTTSRSYMNTEEIRVATDLDWNPGNNSKVYYKLRGVSHIEIRGYSSVHSRVVVPFKFENAGLQKNESGFERSFRARGDLTFSSSYAPNVKVTFIVRMVQLELITVDEHYYKFHESVYKSDRSNDNPFAEPTQVYTNISGGLGCFGAANHYVKDYRMNVEGTSVSLPVLP
jgi:hypothetical protein